MPYVNSLPTLQGPPDITTALQMLSDGLQQRRERQKEDQKNILSRTIGARIGTGDYAGAESAAFGSGDLSTGLKVHELSLADKKQFAETVQRYTLLADTPEKWQAVRSKLTEVTGQDPGDFDTGRTSLLSEFGNLDDILKANQEAGTTDRANQQLDISKQELELKKQEAANGGKPPPGYAKADDGTLKPIPGGPADLETISAQNVARAAGKGVKPPDQLQRKNAQLYEVIAPELEVVKKNFNDLAGFWNQTGASTPLVGNYLTSTKYQEAHNSLQTIISSYLYSVSGQTANPGEVATQTDILMPKRGDGKEAVANKLKRIETMVDSVKRASAGGSADLTAGPAAPVDPTDENTPPDGVDPQDWKFLTPEERQQYIDAGQ